MIAKVAYEQQTDQYHYPMSEEKPVDLATMSKEPGAMGCQGTGLGDLPESSIAHILGFTTTRDVARLACVSNCFRAASESDMVWQTRLPSSYADILAQAPNAPASTVSKKDVYNFLCNPVLLQHGTRDFWLDRATGKACQSIGARDLCLFWGSSKAHWNFCSNEGSRFSEVAYVKSVWWLMVKGRWQCTLSPGTYTFYWRLRLPRLDGNPNYYRDYDSIGPVTFAFEASGNEPVETVCRLTGQGARTMRRMGRGGAPEGRPPLGYRWDCGMRWMELDVGEFTVESESPPFDMEFSLKDDSFMMSKPVDLYIDGVGIRPSSTIRNRIALSELEGQDNFFIPPPRHR